MAPPAQTFEDAIAVTPLSSHTYAANLWLEWCIGSVPHGGYVTSLFLHTATTHLQNTHPTLHSGHPHPITLHLTFLRRTAAGPATFTVADTKLGSRTSTLHITLSQHDPDGAVRDEVAGYITVSNLDAEEGPSLRTGYEMHPRPQSVDLTRLGGEGYGDWQRFHIAFSAMRKASQHVEFYTPVRTGERAKAGLVEQWVRFAPYGKRGRWTDVTLGYLADMFPMMLETFDERPWGDGDMKKGAVAGSGSGEVGVREKSGNQMATYWYPTVLLNIDFKKKLPAEGVEWLYSRVQTKVLRNGRMDLDIVLMDEKGEVVALSNHVALIVSAQRNISPRKGNGNGNGNGKGKGKGASKI
ncbi:hypothetical protein AJ79_08085 [Helicocarpus griseus UAMH5409]|uniref:Thioesterase domain-containing protein n=1 Tax=Helicocarpus griseus UAMH5409 TaxID=1447875 RepID=A0A2B7WN85_9EURO|nr:hypothetical protein AJ79_08085 [Helicocarpus griseus UAMH5409]